MNAQDLIDIARILITGLQVESSDSELLRNVVGIEIKGVQAIASLDDTVSAYTTM
jgi:hypothetical protein